MVREIRYTTPATTRMYPKYHTVFSNSVPVSGSLPGLGSLCTEGSTASSYTHRCSSLETSADKPCLGNWVACPLN
eukprot:368455-Amphidinium_carterae.1